MIRLLKRLLQAMIEIGETIITAITIGTSAVQKIDWGTDQVWPVDTGHSITISPSSTAVTSAAQTTYITIYVTADTNTWTVSTSDSWITDLEKRSNSQARFKVSGNTAIDGRTGTIEFKIDGDTYATYTVTQAAAAPVISLYPTSIEKEFNGTTGTVYVTTNIPSWQAYKQPDVSWASITANTNSIDYYIATNTGETNRRFWIVASGMGASAETEIFQYAGYVFRTSDGTSSLNLSSGGGSFAITVVSQYRGNRTPAVYSISNNDIGLQFASSGSTDVGYYFAFGVPSRSATTSGMASIVFTQVDSQRTITYRINQSGAAPSDYIILTPSGYTGANAVTSGGTNVSIHVATNASTWTASTDASWMALTKRTSGGNQYLDVSIGMNLSSTTRSAVINFTAGTATAYATIEQNPREPDYLTISPAGYTGANAVSSAGSVVYFTVSSNQTWTASTTSSWLSLTKQSSTSLKVTVGETTSLDVRSGSVAFNIGSVNYATAIIEQEPKPYSIEGFNIFASYGDWVIGYYETGSYVGQNPVINIAIVNKVGNFYDEHSFKVSMKYTNLGNAQQTVTNQTYTIHANPNGYTINIPNGGTCNGYPIVGGQKSLDEVTFFEEI